MSCGIDGDAVVVRLVDEQHGNAAFAAKPIAAGTVVMVEPPFIAVQQLMFEEQGIACCAYCLAFVCPLHRELERLRACVSRRADDAAAESEVRRQCQELLSVWPDVDSVSAAFAEVGSFEGSGLLRESFLCPNGCGSVFCSRECYEASCCEGHTLVCCCAPESSCSCNLGMPSARDVVVACESGVPESCKKCTLRLLLHLSTRFNERLRFIVQLLCKIAAQKHSMEQFLDGYAEGPMKTLNEQQRSLLRYSHVLLARLVDSFPGTSAKSIGFGIQQYLALISALDANVHTCIVVNPLFMLLQSLKDAADAKHDKLIQSLEMLTHLIAAEELHNMGVALYQRASKFNHSCMPNVKFIPTKAPVRAFVISLRDISVSEELRCSYVNLDADHGGAVDAVRKEYLRRAYGFVCDCPLCSEHQ